MRLGKLSKILARGDKYLYIQNAEAPAAGQGVSTSLREDSTSSSFWSQEESDNTTNIQTFVTTNTF